MDEMEENIKLILAALNIPRVEKLRTGKKCADLVAASTSIQSPEVEIITPSRVRKGSPEVEIITPSQIQKGSTHVEIMEDVQIGGPANAKKVGSRTTATSTPTSSTMIQMINYLLFHCWFLL